MIRITTLLLFVTSIAFGQDIPKAITHLQKIKAQADSAILALTPKPVEKTYTPYPEAPTFTGTTITTSAGGFNIDDKKLAGQTNVILTDGTAANISMTYTVGTKDKPIQFRPQNVGKTQIGGNKTADRSAFYGSGNPRHISFSGFRIKWKHGGFQFPGGTAENPSTISAENTTFEEHNFAGLWVNASAHYGKINTNFIRIFKTGGEGIYEGSTTKSALSTITESTHTNLYVDSTQWDGVQITNVKKLLIDHATIRNTGLANKDGHKRLMQIHASPGLISNTVMDGGNSCLELFTKGTTFDNVYISWNNGNDQIFVGEWTYSALPAEDIVINKAVFVVPGEGPLFNVSAAFTQKIIVKNSIICKNKSLGARVVDGGGNVYIDLDKIDRPKYKLETDQPAGMKPAYLIIGYYHDIRGMGFRSHD